MYPDFDKLLYFKKLSSTFTEYIFQNTWLCVMGFVAYISDEANYTMNSTGIEVLSPGSLLKHVSLLDFQGLLFHLNYRPVFAIADHFQKAGRREIRIF